MGSEMCIRDRFKNGGRRGKFGFQYMETRFGRPSFELWNMASSSSVANDTVILTQDDIPGASLAGRNPSSLKNEELRFWLRCPGDSLRGLKTKALLVKR